MAVPRRRGTAIHVVAKDSRGNVVHAPDKVVALVGVENLVVVDTPDALLVMDINRSQQVGEVVRSLDDASLEEYT